MSALILIHTSVKLVTNRNADAGRRGENFNPHEREARDLEELVGFSGLLILIHTSVKLVTKTRNRIAAIFSILIHTSVKLVTEVKTNKYK